MWSELVVWCNPLILTHGCVKVLSLSMWLMNACCVSHECPKRAGSCSWTTFLFLLSIFSEICKYRHLHILHSLIKYVPNFVFWILPYALTKCNEQTEGSATQALCPHRPCPIVFPVQDVIMHSRFYFINRLLINVRQSIMRSCVCSHVQIWGRTW